MILTNRPLKYVDQLGATLSMACALHCALQPLLLALPLLGLSFLLNETLETVFLAISLTMAIWAFLSGYAHHRRPTVFLFWGLAAALIGASRIPQLENQEILLAVSGALALMSGHLLNQYLHRQHHLAPLVVSETPQISTLQRSDTAILHCSHSH